MEPRHAENMPCSSDEQSSSASRLKSKIKSKIRTVFKSKPPLFDPGVSHKSTTDATILPSERRSSIRVNHRIVEYAPAQTIYKSLNPYENEFRLLRIDNLDSCCPSTTLHTFSLDAAPEYYALSYHWGSTSRPLPVTINGHHRKVTKNLSIALHQLYDLKVKVRLDRDAYFWIDALCINQEDFEERNHQVTNMRTIYSQAEAVYISVGDATDDSYLVPSLVQKLVACETDPNQLGQIIHSDYNQEFHAFQAFLRRKYWTRVWVVQEVNSAKQAHILCGKDIMAWAILLRAQSIILAAGSAVYKLMNYEPDLVNLITYAEYRGSRGLLSHIGSQEPTLLEALKWHCLKQASLPEDKVYAIIGITTAKDDPALVVDYNRGVERLYIDTTKYIIQSTKRLDVICAMQKRPFKEDICEMDIPTWTVNWVDRVTSDLYGPWAHVQATGSKEAYFEFSSDNKSVVVEGMYLGTISSLASYDYNPHWWEESPEIRRNRVVDNFYEVYFASHESSPEQGDLPNLLRLCRNFTCGIVNMDVEVLSNLSDEEATEMILSVFAYRLTERHVDLPEAMIVLATNLRARFDERDIESWSNIILDDLYSIFLPRRIFMCDNGLIGSGYGKSDVGCEVWAIMGCRALVVLKPTGNDEGGKERYEVIGDAYCDGYMKGEVLTEVEEGTRKVKKIVLI